MEIYPRRGFKFAEGVRTRTVWSMTKWRKEKICNSARLIWQNVWETRTSLKTHHFFKGWRWNWHCAEGKTQKSGNIRELRTFWVIHTSENIVNTMVCTQNKIAKPTHRHVPLPTRRAGLFLFVCFFFVVCAVWKYCSLLLHLKWVFGVRADEQTEASRHDV